VISRAIAYHGTPQGALSHSPASRRQADVRATHAGWLPVPNTNFYRAPEHADDLEGVRAMGRRSHREAIEFEGPDTVAAVFLEPVQNSGGCFPPPPVTSSGSARSAIGTTCSSSRTRSSARSAARQHVRVHQVRLRARHDHLRQGHDERLLPIGAMIASDRIASRSGTARRTSRTATPSAAIPVSAAVPWPTSTSSSRKAASSACSTTRPPSGRRWRSCSTCRSSAMCAATGTSTASRWSRTRQPRRRSTTTSRSGCCAVLVQGPVRGRLYCRADDRGDPVVQFLAAVDHRPA
jgi:hypothetical protein